jgi:alpha-tubulin suppressor-like RCC1 family protein
MGTDSGSGTDGSTDAQDVVDAQGEQVGDVIDAPLGSDGSPHRVAVSIGVAGTSACLVEGGGGVQCWGNNTVHQLGNDSPRTSCSMLGTSCSIVPIPVTTIDGAAAVAVGGGTSCALVSGGAVECWGFNQTGQLGNGNASLYSTAVPQKVAGLSATSVSVGMSSACAVTAEGAVQCWGSNALGLLGSDTGRSVCGSAPCSPSPIALTSLGTGIKAVSVGWTSACAVTAESAVKCWGSNSYGQLGVAPPNVTSSTAPLEVAGVHGVSSVSVGANFACALTVGGEVDCWGDNGKGQLGGGSLDPTSPTPIQVSGLSSGVVAISAGGASACALQTGGGVVCWGANNVGQLGDGSKTLRRVPVQVIGLGSGVRAISAGTATVCALMLDGGVRCWGDNADGELGNGTVSVSATPVVVKGF